MKEFSELTQCKIIHLPTSGTVLFYKRNGSEANLNEIIKSLPILFQLAEYVYHSEPQSFQGLKAYEVLTKIEKL
jgi:hypothetical protein